jgi:hypothetical protein
MRRCPHMEVRSILSGLLMEKPITGYELQNISPDHGELEES